MTIYEENGYEDRKTYLDSLDREYGVSAHAVVEFSLENDGE